MKKFDVCFSSQTKGNQIGFKLISAESPEDAFQKFIIGKSHNDFEVVVVSASSFWDSIRTMPESFPNPLYRPVEIKTKTPQINDASANEYSLDNSYKTMDKIGIIQSGKLDRLIELQEKQLYWIRIIGIPFLFAAIGGFLAILFR